jgi:hypothetical protein
VCALPHAPRRGLRLSSGSLDRVSCLSRGDGWLVLGGERWQAWLTARALFRRTHLAARVRRTAFHRRTAFIRRSGWPACALAAVHETKLSRRAGAQLIAESAGQLGLEDVERLVEVVPADRRPLPLRRDVDFH